MAAAGGVEGVAVECPPEEAECPRAVGRGQTSTAPRPLANRGVAAGRLNCQAVDQAGVAE